MVTKRNNHSRFQIKKLGRRDILKEISPLVIVRRGNLKGKGHRRVSFSEGYKRFLALNHPLIKPFLYVLSLSVLRD